jgi:hypothetical protein
MRRMLLLVTVAGMLLAFAASPAFGEAAEPASCVAEANTTAEPGAVGKNNRFFAQEYGSLFGRALAEFAQSDESGCAILTEGGPPGKPVPGPPFVGI